MMIYLLPDSPSKPGLSEHDNDVCGLAPISVPQNLEVVPIGLARKLLHYVVYETA
jgi:hypothetical protein